MGFVITKTTTKHDVYLGDENIGSFDTTDSDISYDDGWRTEETRMMKLAKFTSPFAIIFRLIGIVMAVIAFFIPRMLSSVHVPKIAKQCGYIVVIHCLCDIIILKCSPKALKYRQ